MSSTSHQSHISWCKLGEFKAAVEEAKLCNATVLLGDQDVDVTLQRLAAALSQVDSKALNSLLDKLSQVEEELGLSLPKELDAVNKEEISTFVEQMKQKRSVNKLLAVIQAEAPTIYNALIGNAIMSLIYIIIIMLHSLRIQCYLNTHLYVSLYLSAILCTLI